MPTASAGRGHVGFAALDRKREIALVLRGVNGLRFLALRAVDRQARDAQHRLARFRVLAVRHAECFAAPVQFGRVAVRQRQALRAVLLLDRNRREAVALD